MSEECRPTCSGEMAGLQNYLENSSSDQLLELLSRYLGTPEAKRDCDFYLSLKSALITLKERDRLLDDLVCRVTHELCLPLVRCRDSQADRHKIHIVYEIVALCCVVGHKDLAHEVVILCLEGLSNHSKDIITATGLPVVVCIDLVSYLMKCDNKHVFSEDVQKELFENLLTVLYASDELLCMKITSSVLPLFLSEETEDGRQNVKIVWRRIKEMSSDKHNDDGLKSCYTIMCSLADYFIANSNSSDIVLWDSKFWELIQQGLIIKDPLSSKRSMYLLKRALDHVDQQKLNMEVKNDQGAVIFYWKPEEKKHLMDIWEEFVVLMETLNETQVHVIIPVLPRISKVIFASEIKQLQDGSQALHISWLTTVISKASLHPSRFIRKWAVMEILTMDLCRSPLVLPTNWSFLLGHFQAMLNEYSLYGKDDNSGTTSPIGIALIPFYNLCLSYIPKEQHVSFLSNLVTSIEKQRFTPVPVAFVSHALSNIENASVLGVDVLLKLRNILFHLSTHAVNLRMPTKGFLLMAATKLTDPNLLGWDVIYNFLATGQLEECLTRGSWLWNCLCEWLCKIETENQAVRNKENSLKGSKFSEGLFNFLGLKVENFLNNPDVDENAINNDAEALARLTIAAVDTLHNKQCSSDGNGRSSPLVPILNKITQNFQDASTRLYMSETKLSKSAALLCEILRVLNPSDKCKSYLGSQGCSHDFATNVVSESLSKALPDILSLIRRKLTTPDESRSGKTYLGLCDSLHCYFAENSSLNSRRTEFDKFIENVVIISIKTIQRSQSTCIKNYEPKEWLRFQQSMLFVSWCCGIISANNDISASISEQVLHAIPSFQLNLEFKKPEMVASAMNGEITSSEAAKSTSVTWGSSVSEFMSGLWTTSVFFLQRTKDVHEETTTSSDIVVVTCQAKDVLSAALDALDITSNVRPIIKSIGLLIPKLLEEDVDCCGRALDVVWSTLRVTWESTSFWEDFPILLSVIFSPVLLMLPESHPLTKKTKGYLQVLLAEGEIRPGVMHVVIQQLSNVWVEELKTDCHSSILIHFDTIIELLLFGPMINKARRIESHVEAYLRHLGDQSPVMPLDMRDDDQVRVIMINTLLSLDISKTHIQDIIKSIIRSLILVDKEISATQTVIYISSQCHRKKHRAWQTVLMFLPLVLEHDTEGDYAKEILQSVFTSILDQNQVSVHNFQEWIVLCILTRYPNLTTLLWDELLYHSDKRIGRVVSLVTIAMLFAIHCVPADQTKRASYFSRALNAVFPWVTTNNRSVRVIAQVAVQKIWYYCVSEDLVTVLKDNAIVEPCLTLVTAANDTLAEKIRLLENYFFFDFDPIRDYSVQTIYHTIPKHSNITEEEWVSPEEFLLSSLGKTLWMSSKCNGIPLYNKDRRLSNFETIPYDYHSKEKIGFQFDRRFREERKPCLKVAETKARQESDSPALNFQKKMIAWKIVPPEEIMMSELQQQRMVALQKSSGGNLVVVASLIDKAPNLGGLCRTSEIFGVRKLVLGSTEVMKDQSFKKLSVSSSKWIDIEQVRPINLKKYLENMRRQGYTLIGVEQTANSQPLTKFQFPHDALLLLGNEKEGIPADLIQLLDECVEIPQLGIIRSLNVHVSGALLIWEYARQHVLTAKNTTE